MSIAPVRLVDDALDGVDHTVEDAAFGHAQ
jgi:hypothetical protein